MSKEKGHNLTTGLEKYLTSYMNMSLIYYDNDSEFNLSRSWYNQFSEIKLREGKWTKF